MPRLTKIYTRTGDDGTTALGSGQRVPKDSLRIECYGTVDELNAAIGLALAGDVEDDLRAALRRIQNELFHLGSDLCFPEEEKRTQPVPHVEPAHVGALEQLIDRLNAALPPLENFVLPGGSEAAARLHVARCVCRRAERLAVALRRQEGVGGQVVPYLNRLSDLLFVMARHENRRAGVADVYWDSRA
jgi:cob(I)alamin adenosyltransferase